MLRVSITKVRPTEIKVDRLAGHPEQQSNTLFAQRGVEGWLVSYLKWGSEEVTESGLLPFPPA